MSRVRRAFTLIELLVVIAIIALLMALLVPAVQKVREAMNKAACANNLHQIGIAIHNFHDTWGKLPSGSLDWSPSMRGKASVMAQILPFMEKDAQWKLFDFTVGPPTHLPSADVHNTVENRQARLQQIKSYLCPSDGSDGVYVDGGPVGKSNYLANIGRIGWWRSLEGPFHHNSVTRLTDLLDGTSTTALIAEVKRGPRPKFEDDTVSTSVAFGVWDSNLPQSDLSPLPECENRSAVILNYTGLQYHRGFLSTGLYTHTVPPNYKGRDCIRASGFDRGHYAARSYHPNGVNVLFGDGNVRFVTNDIQLEVWRAYGSRKGKEVVDF